MMQEEKLIAFDMDSTLIQCEVIDEIAKHNQVYDQVSLITERAMRGELDFNQSLSERVALLKGTPLDTLHDFADQLPYTHGIESCINYLKLKNYRIIILSGGFDLFAQRIADRFHFDAIKTNQLEIKDDKLTGRVVGEIINAEKKAYYLNYYAKEFNIPMYQTAAVGDGANDVLMLNTAKIGIAFCAKPIVQEQVEYAIDKADLSLIKIIL